MPLLLLEVPLQMQLLLQVLLKALLLLRVLLHMLLLNVLLLIRVLPQGLALNGLTGATTIPPILDSFELPARPLPTSMDPLLRCVLTSP